jgi:hypothetical protein
MGYAEFPAKFSWQEFKQSIHTFKGENVMKKTFFGSSLLTFVVLAISQAMQPAYAATSLVYVPLDAPCRVSDTRGTSSASIPADTSIDLLAYGDATDLGPQGGTQDCLNPITGSIPVAIAANVTAVGNQASGNGNVVAYPAGGTVPTASLVNYTSSGNIANSTIIALCEGLCSADFTVRSNFASVPVLVDVLGYYYPKTLLNVITVSAANGDFTSPIDAINSIPTTGLGTATPANRYVINLGPGTYDLGSGILDMRSYISVIGAGVNSTIIQSASGNAVVRFRTVRGSALAALTVINIGNGTNNVTGVLIDTDDASATNPHLYDLRIIAEGATVETKAIQVQQGAGTGLVAPLIERVEAVARDPVSGEANAINLRVCARLERVNAFGESTGLILGTDVDCADPILWSQFTGTTAQDVFANPAASAAIAHSHLVNGTITTGGGVGTINCLAVTSPAGILNRDCSAPTP